MDSHKGQLQVRFDLGAHMPSLRLGSFWVGLEHWTGLFLQGRPREKHQGDHSYFPLSPLLLLALLQWKPDLGGCSAGAQALKRLTVHTQAPGKAGRQCMPSHKREGPCLHLQGPEETGCQGAPPWGSLKGHRQSPGASCRSWELLPPHLIPMCFMRLRRQPLSGES